MVYRLEYSEAVARGLVAPLKLLFLNVSEAYARQAARAPGLVAVASDTAASRELAELSAALLDCRDSHGVRTAFAFCANNRRAAELERAASAALAARGIALARVSGRMDAGTRAAVLEPVRRATARAPAPGAAAAAGDTMSVVTNCRVLAEGIDLPAVDLVVFADPKTSHVDILQSMGRASRLSPGKPCGHVLVPVTEAGADAGGFETAVAVVRAYAEQDREFREALAAVVAGEARLNRSLAREEWPEALRRVVDVAGGGDALADRTLCFEHQAARAVRRGRYKAVWGKRMPQAPTWELYDRQTGRCETNDLAAARPALTAELAAAWQQWAVEVGVHPFWQEAQQREQK